MLAFAQTLEVAARDLYDVALDTEVFDEMQRSVIATIREAHEAYAASLSAILGRPMAQIPDPIGEDLKAAFGGDLAGVLDAAYDLESTLVATYTEMLGNLQGVNGAALVASILIVEAANGTVLADLKNATDLDELLVVPEAEALTPLARETP
jgi:Ferritin-like domain